MVQQTSNRHIQVVMNNRNFLIHKFRLLGCEEIWGFVVTQIFLRLFHKQSLCLEGNVLQISYQVQYTQGSCSIHAHSTLINRLKPWCGGVPSGLCSTWCAMPVCDVRIVPTISRLLRAVAAVVVIIPNVRCWSWARMCCVWKLPNLSYRPVRALTNTTGWKCRKIRITRWEKSRFYPVLAKIRINRGLLYYLNL